MCFRLHEVKFSLHCLNGPYQTSSRFFLKDHYSILYQYVTDADQIYLGYMCNPTAHDELVNI